MNRAACFFILISAAAAQQPTGLLQFDWDKLAAKATDKTDINLSGPMLQMGSQFLSQAGGDAAKLKEVVQSLKGVYVKTFEFDKEGQYTEADLSALRSQLRAPDWSAVIDTKEKRESTVILMKSDGSKVQGLVIISAEPKELTVVQIIGSIDPSMLSQLGGKMGIPHMEMGPKSKTAPQKKDDE
jgi:Domain of unknown function (DUF4252)